MRWLYVFNRQTQDVLKAPIGNEIKLEIKFTEDLRERSYCRRLFSKRILFLQPPDVKPVLTKLWL